MYEAYISRDKQTGIRATTILNGGKQASYEAEDALLSCAQSTESQGTKDRSATISFGSSIITASPAIVSRKSPATKGKAHGQASSPRSRAVVKSSEEDRTPSFSEWGSNLKAN